MNRVDSSAYSDITASARDTWTGRFDFFLSAVGYAVGLGNVWRFPYLCYENGGASFLFPYVIMLGLAGIPLFFLELCIGQFTSQGPLTAWRMAPAFAGIGYAMVMVSAVVSIYYNMIIAYALYYMLVSLCHLDGGLPWETCGNAWNTAYCRNVPLPRVEELKFIANGTESLEMWKNLYEISCLNETMIAANDTGFRVGNLSIFNSSGEDQTVMFKNCEVKYNSPTEEYYKAYMLNEKAVTSLDNIESVSLRLMFVLAVAWLLVFLCLMKGVKSSGRVVYFTATFPYVVLVILFIRGVTLEGAATGLQFYLVPDWGKLLDSTVWASAATQIFYSLGVGFGGLLTMASYNRFQNDVFRDALTVSTINCGTSIFAGFAIFSLLGHMAHVTHRDVSSVAASGQGLAFVAYPDGISRLPWSPVWSFLFFFMILTLGLDSQFGMMETVLTGLADLFPGILRKHKTTFTFMVCTCGFLLGIPLCTEGGGRVLSLMDNYSGSYNLMIIALLEICAIVWVYGLRNFQEDIEMMLGKKSRNWWGYWVVCWKVVTPLAVIFIVWVSAVQYKRSTYNGVEIVPWAEAVGFLMVTAPICVFLAVGVWMVVTIGPTNAWSPLDTWGPARREYQVGRYSHMLGREADSGGRLPLRLSVSIDIPLSNGANNCVESNGIHDKDVLSNGFDIDELHTNGVSNNDVRSTGRDDKNVSLHSSTSEEPTAFLNPLAEHVNVRL